MHKFPRHDTKLLIVAVALILSGCSSYPAGPYEKANADQNACKSAGQIAVMAYQGKMEGKPSLDWMLNDSAKRAGGTPYPFPEIAQESVRRGYAANSKSDAHMAAWSYCMDRLR